MSYILDALKKSEQERGHGTAPNVQTNEAYDWSTLLRRHVFI